MTVVFHDEALRELREARDWYTNEGAPEQAERLLDAVDARMARILERPEAFPRDPKRAWARRARLLGWPYTLIFTMDGPALVIVLAVAHHKRRPDYWTKRRP